MSNYRINGQDPETTYGMVIEKGIDAQIVKIPSLKDNGLSISWAGENGTDRYHGIRRFESKTYQIQCVIKGSSKADVLAKYSALETFLTTNGIFNLDDISKNRRWKVFFNSMPSLATGSTWVRFTIELVDDYPTEKFTIS